MLETIRIIAVDMAEKTQWKIEFRNMSSIFRYVSRWYFCTDAICPPKILTFFSHIVLYVSALTVLGFIFGFSVFHFMYYRKHVQ